MYFSDINNTTRNTTEESGDWGAEKGETDAQVTETTETK